MFEARREDQVTIIRASGDLPRAEMVAIAAVARKARAEGRRVVIDLKRVTHLHFVGAALLQAIPGLRAAGASRYVRDLVRAGAGADVELFGDVEEALRVA